MHTYCGNMFLTIQIYQGVFGTLDTSEIVQIKWFNWEIASFDALWYQCIYKSWPLFIKPDQLVPLILDQLKSLLCTIMPVHLQNFVTKICNCKGKIAQSLQSNFQWIFNSSPLSAAYMCQWIGSTLVQVMAWRRTGAKPLPTPMLIYC